jgi:hypothetical protein
MLLLARWLLPMAARFAPFLLFRRGYFGDWLPNAWLRQAYFGQLLDGHPRAIRVFDTFPSIRANGQVLYCLTLEYARHGDLSAFLSRGGKGWSEAGARREKDAIADK